MNEIPVLASAYIKFVKLCLSIPIDNYHKSTMSHESFIREYRTFSINYGRQTGKTLSIVELMSVHQDMILITFSCDNAKRIMDQYPHTEGRVFGSTTFNNMTKDITKSEGMNFGIVVIEEPSYTLPKMPCLFDNQMLEVRGNHTIFKIGM